MALRRSRCALECGADGGRTGRNTPIADATWSGSREHRHRMHVRDGIVNDTNHEETRRSTVCAHTETHTQRHSMKNTLATCRAVRPRSEYRRPSPCRPLGRAPRLAGALAHSTLLKWNEMRLASPLRKSATAASTPQRRRILSAFFPCVVAGRRHNLGHLLLRSLDLTLLEEMLNGAQRGLGDHVLAALLIELH